MEPNRNDPPKNPKDGNKRPKGSLWIALLITAAIVLAFGTIYNSISKSQYTETTYSDFKAAMDAGNLSEVELQYDRVIYMTKEEAAKPR